MEVSLVVRQINLGCLYNSGNRSQFLVRFLKMAQTFCLFVLRRHYSNRSKLYILVGLGRLWRCLNFINLTNLLKYEQSRLFC